MFTTTDPEMQGAKTVLYVVTGYAVWTILLGLYLGIKGIAESRNPSGGRLHIFLARLIGIINLVLAVILGLSLLDSTDFWHDFETFGLCVIDLIFMFSYASAAKAVRNGAD
jgi:peptidoglycan/LPS O-acetylase OafA/YrhL